MMSNSMFNYGGYMYIAGISQLFDTGVTVSEKALDTLEDYEGQALLHRVKVAWVDFIQYVQDKADPLIRDAVDAAGKGATPEHVQDGS